MNFAKVVPLLISGLQKANVDFAFIGGIAVYLSGVSRTTKDVDFLALLSDSGKVDTVMKALGYKVLHASEDVANYWREGPDGGRVDFIFAHRPYSRSMLERAKSSHFLNSDVKSVSPEDLIGLKVQAIANNPSRLVKDQFDIEELMRKHAKSMDWALIRDYYALFEKQAEFDELREKYGGA